ncbi:MAG: cupin domain-containing protein [Gammaproteobacteria bacterium]|nr:cupin domain-containing protein [Gammaproteobacteria bacterium]
MKASAKELLAKLPGPTTKEWPQGERFAQAFAHGSMSVEFYAPRGKDPQTPHEQDEIYIIHSGSGEFVERERRTRCKAGDALFVAAGVPHRFENFTANFSTWVVFWGPKGGESSH